MLQRSWCLALGCLPGDERTRYIIKLAPASREDSIITRTRTHKPHSAATMYVIKRDGRQEPVHFDKITARLKKLAYGLNQDFCDPVSREMARIDEAPAISGGIFLPGGFSAGWKRGEGQQVHRAKCCGVAGRWRPLEPACSPFSWSGIDGRGFGDARGRIPSGLGSTRKIRGCQHCGQGLGVFKLLAAGWKSPLCAPTRRGAARTLAYEQFQRRPAFTRS